MVLDEADQMLKQGFKKPVLTWRSLLSCTKIKLATLDFSLIAFASRVLEVVNRVTPDPPQGHAAVVAHRNSQSVPGLVFIRFPMVLGL